MTEYQHRPDQGHGGERQFIIYLFLAFVLVLLFEGLVVGPQKKKAEQKPEQKQSQPQAPAAASSAQSTPSLAPVQPAVPLPAAAKSKKRAAKSAAPTEKPVHAASEQQITIESDLYRVTFSNRGAQVTSWILKKYKDAKGKPLDLINSQASPKFGLPLSLWTYDESLRSRLNQALYVATPAGGATLTAPASLTFEYSENGLVVRKRFSFDKSYVLKLETSVTQNGKPVQAYPAWPAAMGDEIAPAGYAQGKLDWETPQGVTHTPAFEHNFIRPSKWVSNGDTRHETFNWAGISDQYFAAIFMPATPADTAAVTLNQPFEIPKNPADANDKETTKVQILGIAVGSPTGSTSARVFVGPKALDVLGTVHANSSGGQADAGPKLEGAIDFGFWGIFAKWLFLWLNWTHDHWIPNWGWAIIILTFIINGAFLPLRLSQMKTSLRMQKVQPRVQDINKKYSKYSMRDQEKQREKQAEMMALYKEEGVNPVGGCLPMLLQLPFLYAFYEVLEVAIELRQAPWAWISDLSAPDPWHILPIVTVITMFILQNMTPTPGMDPQQRKMMNITMVGVFGFMTWAVSAGLALYWTVSNVIYVGQQVFLNRSKLGREIREVQEKRARKKKK